MSPTFLKLPFMRKPHDRVLRELPPYPLPHNVILKSLTCRYWEEECHLLPVGLDPWRPSSGGNTAALRVRLQMTNDCVSVLATHSSSLFLVGPATNAADRSWHSSSQYRFACREAELIDRAPRIHISGRRLG